MILLVFLVEVCWTFAFVFVICEFGQKLSDGFNGIDDECGQFDWYLHSMEVQKLLPTLIIVTQKPISLKAFGSISGDRQSFKKVSPLFFYNKNLTCACVKFKFTHIR